ncbi:MAG: YbbR-like domain-containing protein [Lachnospiraceae bacterium]
MAEKKIKNNFNMKILSVIIAVIIWIIVGNINDPVISREISGIPVEFVNEKVLDKINKAYELKDSDKISVSVSGKKSIVSKLRAKDFKAKADLSKLSIVDAVPVEVTLNYSGSGQVTIDLGKNTMLKVKIDDVKTAMVPVSVEVKGNPATGYAVGKKSASPNMIEVTGPEATVNKIKEVKLICNVAGSDKSIKKNIDVEFYSESGKKIDDSIFKYDEKSISVLVEIWKQKKIPIEVEIEGEPASGYSVASVEYEPKTVAIAGPDEELSSIDSIELEKVDISGATTDVEKNISLPDTLLPGNIIFQESDKNIAVKVKIGKKTEKKIRFSSEDIKVVGATSKRKVSFLDEEYEIIISGLEREIKNISIEDLSPHIQIDGLLDGNHNVEIELVENKNLEVESIDRADIEIKSNTADGENSTNTLTNS